MKFQHITIVFILSMLMATSCAVNPVTGKKDFMLLSEKGEINLGRQSDPAIVASYGLYANETLQQFINEEGQKMAAISHRPNLPYEFKILDSPVVNAFAVPGGYVYFTRGILAHFNNAAEFSGVLGHEIGHVTARHSAKQYSKNILFQAGFIAGLVISPEFASFADVTQQGIGLLFLKYSRNNESESDRLGVEYSTKVGYDAHHMAEFFKTLDRMRGGTDVGNIPTFMSTHPDPRDRYNTVHALSTEMQQGIDPGTLKENRESYLEMIDGLIYGEDPKQGFVDQDMFYHPVLLFQFPVPADWKTANSPSQVQMAPKSGDALMIFTLVEESSLQAAANATVTENKLTIVDQKNSNVHGFNALVLVSDLQNPQNPLVVTRILSYFIQDGDNIYAFHGLTKKADYQKYAGLFAKSMKGYRRLTDQEKIDRKPERILIKKVGQESELRSFLIRMQVQSDRLEEVAILNGLELSDIVSTGAQIKVISQ